MVYVLHKFRHFLLGNKFFFYVEHMAFVYLVNKPQVSERIAKWMLVLKYEFTIIYKFSKNTCGNGWFYPDYQDSSKPLGVLD